MEANMTCWYFEAACNWNWDFACSWPWSVMVLVTGRSGHGTIWSRDDLVTCLGALAKFPLSLDWRERPEMAGRTINTSKVLGHHLLSDFLLLFDLKESLHRCHLHKNLVSRVNFIVCSPCLPRGLKLDRAALSPLSPMKSHPASEFSLSQLLTKSRRTPQASRKPNGRTATSPETPSRCCGSDKRSRGGRCW
jgi:hypothetical protein